MNHTFVYVGCFLPPEEFRDRIRSLRRNPLERTILHPHVTFAYHPDAVDLSLFGREVRVRLIGYGNDGVNEGVQVTLHTEDSALQTMIGRIAFPHITVSVASQGRSVNTAFLRFTPITPMELTGRFGGYAYWNEVIT